MIFVSAAVTVVVVEVAVVWATANGAVLVRLWPFVVAGIVSETLATAGATAGAAAVAVIVTVVIVAAAAVVVAAAAVVVVVDDDDVKVAVVKRGKMRLGSLPKKN